MEEPPPLGTGQGASGALAGVEGRRGGLDYHSLKRISSRA